MPGWHKKTKELVNAGKLSVAGIVQEQHPDRASLYMQWQQMKWPVLADPYNDLGISAVPITLLIDEHGIIRHRNPKNGDLLRFLETDYPNDAKKQPVHLLPKGIEELKKLIAVEPSNARAHFRLGVAYRTRFDSNRSKSNDFNDAMVHWQKALDLNPNQYIWRRRIQQYGPRLDKPYSFYDWVVKAREEITARGDKPVKLIAEPSGAEFAMPSRVRKSKVDINVNQILKHPDPENKLMHDVDELVSSQVVVVPSTNKKNSAVRVHLTLKPEDNTTWTNDAGNISIYLDSNSSISLKDLNIPILPNSASSAEARVIEFELHSAKGKGTSLPKKVNAAAFYYVCAKNDSTCKFLRQDVSINLK